jgi:hypothetical protein
MKFKTWIWTAVLAFIGYAIETRGAVENLSLELTGAAVGGAIGLCIGIALQRYDKRRSKQNGRASSL